MIKFPGGDECAVLDDAGLSACKRSAAALSGASSSAKQSNSRQPTGTPEPSQLTQQQQQRSSHNSQQQQQHTSGQGVGLHHTIKVQQESHSLQQEPSKLPQASCWSVGLRANNNSALQQTLDLLPVWASHPALDQHSNTPGVSRVGGGRGAEQSPYQRGLDLGSGRPVRQHQGESRHET
ncbi:MAG: hypothetical protein WDW38_010870 [Sanguina aurantia]